MKFLEVFLVRFDFRFVLVVALSLEAVETSDHLGFYQPYESDHLRNLRLLRNPSCVFSLQNFEKLVFKSMNFIFKKENEIGCF